MKNWRRFCDPLPLGRLGCAWVVCLACLHGSAAAQQSVPLTTGPGEDTEAAWSPNGRQIAFQSDRSGTLGLYVLDTSTAETRPLVTHPGHACFPAWSPDGRWIVYSYAHFTATGFEGQPNGYNLFLVPTEGGEPRRLTEGLHRDYCPAFAPDGKTIWFCSDRDRRKDDNAVGLYTIRVDGGDPVQVCGQAGRDRAFCEPCLSPDGRTLVCSRLRGFRDNWTIHLASLDNPADTVPLTDPRGAFYSPQWSPGGATLACTGFEAGNPGWGVYLIDARTARRLRVVCGPGNSRSPVWSPDGRQLVFEDNRTGSYKLYRIEAPTTRAREMAAVLVKITEELVIAVPRLRNRSDMKGIVGHCVEINRLENEADSIVRFALAELFDGTPLIEVIKWREIYEHLETAVDKGEDVANVLEAVVLKHG